MDSAEKIIALRALMKELGIDAFLIPNSDEYLSEYTAPYSKRLKWLTNFSGSSGFALILQDKALLFTDGRYQIQIKSETDNHLFSYFDSTKISLTQWIIENNQSFILGYDAWLHAHQEIETLNNAVTLKGGFLKSLKQNPIDLIWKDQPEKPSEEIYLHEIQFSGKSIKDKLDAVKNKLKSENVNAFLFADPTSLAWLFNIRGSDIEHVPIGFSRAIIFLDQKDSPFQDTIFIDKKKLNKESYSYLENFLNIVDLQDFLPNIEKIAKIFTSSFQLGLDSKKTVERIYSIFTKENSHIKIMSDPVIALRSIKNFQEIKGMLNAQKRDSFALIRFLSWLDRQKIGTISEKNCVDKILHFRQEAGLRDQMFLQDISFDTIAGSGPNGAIIHYRVCEKTNRLLQEGDLFLIDSGAQYKDGTTDITRTLAIGTPSWTQKYYYTLVLKALISLTLTRFPRRTRGADLDSIARQILWKNGVDYAHGTGHGVGSYLSVHEGPQAISPANYEILKEGMILSNEPGYYREGAFGIRLENLLLITSSFQKIIGDPCFENTMLAFQTLTFCPFDRKLILKENLGFEALRFIDQYHDKIYRNFYHLLNQEDKNWLYQATRPL